MSPDAAELPGAVLINTGDVRFAQGNIPELGQAMTTKLQVAEGSPTSHAVEANDEDGVVAQLRSGLQVLQQWLRALPLAGVNGTENMEGSITVDVQEIEAPLRQFNRLLPINPDVRYRSPFKNGGVNFDAGRRFS